MDFISILSIFVLACFVGYYVVWSVTPALHTPLMSVTNAISSVIVVGALIAAAAAGSATSKWLGLIAVALASVNIFGGKSRCRRAGKARCRCHPQSDRHIELAADMHYKGQAFELTVPLRSLQLDEAALSVLIDDFHDLHRQFFSYSNPGSAVEIVSLRASAVGRLPKPAAKATVPRDSGHRSASERSGSPAVGARSRCGTAIGSRSVERSRGPPSSRKHIRPCCCWKAGIASATRAATSSRREPR